MFVTSTITGNISISCIPHIGKHFFERKMMYHFVSVTSFCSLKVTDLEIQTISWPKVVEKVVLLQKSQQLCVVKDLSEHDIIMRLMRKQNYLIGMVNKGIIAFPIACWLPGVGPTVSSCFHGRKSYLMLPKTLEWALNWCIFHSMFDR